MANISDLYNSLSSMLNGARAQTTKPEDSTAPSEPVAPQDTCTDSDALYIGLDLGGDTLKIAFAYKEQGTVHYGKFAEKCNVPKVALPALAYYDKAAGKWIYSDQVDKHGNDSFITTVKIKHLISMLAPQASAEGEEKNKDYYFNKSHFPKFYFPVRFAVLSDFDEMVNKGMTFEAPGFTPEKVCKGFFKYIKGLVDARKLELEEQIGRPFSTVKIALVHPAKVGEAYLDQLSKLIKYAFGTLPTKIINSNKALALYALHRNAVKNEQSFLVFDMGEETISVVQATIMNNQVLIDGDEDHNAPIDIGGNNVDEALVNYLEGNINDRETIGSAPAGEPGHIVEDSAYSKQYLLMKDVKNAKVIFSRPLPPDSSFERYGVPLSFHRELLVQRRLKKSEVKACLGTDGSGGIAKRIFDYILGEVKRTVNTDAQKIFLSGGLIETYSLLDYIKSELAKHGVTIPVCTFDDGNQTIDGFKLSSYEDSVFSSAVGGAIIALKNIEIKTVLSRSYGSWYSANGQKFIDFFVERGTDVNKNGGRFESDPFDVYGAGAEGEEIYSTVFTSSKIQAISHNPPHRDLHFYNGKIVIGNFEKTAEEREFTRKCWNAAEKVFDLKVIPARRNGQKAKIRLYYNNKPIRLPSGTKIKAREGIIVSKSGRAAPFIVNDKSSTENKRVQVEVLTLGSRGEILSAASRITINLRDVEPRIDGIDNIDVSLS
ncbi:MAG: hypothetical protein IJ515_01715 [Clostridia bacterium]|nr:hypothetical protein [Clostridia bacterium]